MNMDRLRDGLPFMLERMADVGYSERYVWDTGRFARRLLDAAPRLAGWDEVEAWARSQSSNGGFHLRPYLRTCRRFEEGVLPGDGPVTDPRPRARDGLCAGLAAVLDAYEASDAAARKAPTSVACEVRCAASFLARLEAMGRESVEDVTEDDVIEALTGDDGGPSFGAGYARHLRAVLAGAEGRVAGCRRLMSYVPVPREWRKVQPALSPADAAAVAAALRDEGLGISLRDRAIVWTLMLTGLRSCDVAALRVDSIDWRRATVSLTQQKTGAPLELPLPTQVGNAIFEYATRERAACGDPHVFVSARYPHGRISAAAVRAVAARALEAMGIRPADGGTLGCHAFRRAAITAMLGAGEDRAVVAAVAGHASAETTDGYMVASVEGLRAHASLDVSPFAPGREASL